MKYLRPLHKYDLEFLRYWRSKPEYLRWLRQSRLSTYEDQERWFNSLNPLDCYFIIIDPSKDVKYQLGYCYLKNIDFIHRSAEFGVFSTPQATKGLVSLTIKALDELFNYGFDNLGLNRIYSDVIEKNPSLKLYTFLGFEIEGISRKVYFKNGSFVNSINIGLLKEDWSENISCRSKWINRKKTFKNTETVGA